MKKAVFLSLLAIMLVICGCVEPGPDPILFPGKKTVKEYGPLPGKNLEFKMIFDDPSDWRNNPDWFRWECDYPNEDEYDLSSMLTNNKVYVLTYSFSSNINIDELAVYFYNSHYDENDTVDHWFWETISTWVKININNPNIEGGKEYSGKIVLAPQNIANGAPADSTHLRFNIKNRNVNTKPVLYFYKFELEQVDKEAPGLEEWTVNGKTLTIDTKSTNAKIETTYQGKNNVLHIKTPYEASNYGDFVMQLDLNEYRGKTIEIKMSMDVWLTTPASVAWQINSSPTPFYPVVCGAVLGDRGLTTYTNGDGNPAGPPLSANTWHTISGTKTYTVPNTGTDNDKGKQLYLSGMQIDGAQAYFANASIVIKEKETSTPNEDETVIRTITFEETNNWGPNADWARWYYEEHDDSYDLKNVYNNNKVLIFTYSFISDIYIDELSVWFLNYDGDWYQLTEWQGIGWNIEANTKKSGRIIFVFKNGVDPNVYDQDETKLNFQVKNRNVATPATLTFYEFSFEEIEEQTSLETWDVSGKELIIPSLTFAEKVSFDGRSDVLHIKPNYNGDEYDGFVMQLDLNEYKGKRIEISISMDVYLKEPSWIAWQINSNPIPFYPVVCGTVKGDRGSEIYINGDGNPAGPPLSANTWHTITGTKIFTVPNTAPDNDNGKQLYLSGMQIEGAEAYFANASITITEK